MSNLPGDADIQVDKKNPLQTQDDKKSDHDTLLLSAEFPNSDRFKKSEYWTRPKTRKWMDMFSQWIRSEDWSEIKIEPDPNTKARILIEKLDKAMDKCFPLKRFLTKPTDDPRITPYIKRRIKARKNYSPGNIARENGRHIKKERIN